MLKDFNLKFIIVCLCFIIIPMIFCSAQTTFEGENFITKERIIEKALYPGGPITEGEFKLKGEATLKWNMKINPDVVITVIESPKESIIIKIYSEYLYGPGYKKEIIQKDKIVAILTSEDGGITWAGKNLSSNADILEKAFYPGGPITKGEVKLGNRIIKKWSIIVSKEGTTMTKIEFPVDERIIEAKAKYFGGPPNTINEYVKKKHTSYLSTEDYIKYIGRNLIKNQSLCIIRSYPGQGYWRSWNVTSSGGGISSYSSCEIQYILLSIFNLE